MASHVAVVGAGILGASVAWHLVRAGARVTIIDAAVPGGVASPCSFGWTNASYSNPKPYFDLRFRSMREWERLARDVPGLPFRRTGALYIDWERIDLPAFYAQHSSWGYDLRWIDRTEARRLEPAIIDIPERALISDAEGAAEAEATAQLLVGLSRDAGAVVRPSTSVARLKMSAGRVNGVVCEDGTTIDADRVVLAAGRGTEALAASAGVSVPMTTTPGLILHTEPLSPLVTRMILASWLHVRQQTDGTILAATDFGGGEVNDDPERGAGVLLDLLRKNVRGCEHARIGRTTLGWRPLPADGFPIVGAPADACGLYVVTSHSGATLAPALGLFAAREIVEGVRDPMLAPYGPDRFARATAA